MNGQRSFASYRSAFKASTVLQAEMYVSIQVLKLMVSNSVHRIYVVHSASQATPEHSVTPTDIMQMLSLLHT